MANGNDPGPPLISAATMEHLVASGGAPAKPPRSWELRTSALGALVLLAALAGAAISAMDFVVGRAVAGGTTASLPGWTRDMLLHSHAVDTVYFVSILAYLAGLAWWRGETRTTLLIFGGGDLRPLRSPVLRIWIVFIGLAFLVRIVNTRHTMDPADYAGDLATRLQADGISAALRVLGLLCLLFGVWYTRNRVRETIAHAGARGR